MKIPNWILSENPEFFEKDGEVYAYFCGTLYQYNEFPEVLLEAVESVLLKDEKAKKCLFEMGLDKDSMLKKFICCTLGNFDGESDLCMETLEVKHEYVECKMRGNCKWEGKLCKNIKVECGYITHQEMKVIKLATEGLLDKEIADKLCIATNTVQNHLQNIRQKTGLRSRVEIARWATEKNL
jgi:DNA-binding NarL/FixJ family response regulator